MVYNDLSAGGIENVAVPFYMGITIILLGLLGYISATGQIRCGSESERPAIESKKSRTHTTRDPVRLWMLLNPHTVTKREHFKIANIKQHQRYSILLSR